MINSSGLNSSGLNSSTTPAVTPPPAVDFSVTVVSTERTPIEFSSHVVGSGYTVLRITNSLVNGVTFDNNTSDTLIDFQSDPQFLGTASFQYSTSIIGGTVGTGGTVNIATVTVTVIAPTSPLVIHDVNLSIPLNATTRSRAIPLYLDTVYFDQPLKIPTGEAGYIQHNADLSLGVSQALPVPLDRFGNSQNKLGFELTFTPPQGLAVGDSYSFDFIVFPELPDMLAGVTVTKATPFGITLTNTVTITVVAPVATSTTTAVTIEGDEQYTTPDASDFPIVTQPSNGVVTDVGEGVSYQPNAGYVGSDSFTYRKLGENNLAFLTVSNALPADKAENIANNIIESESVVVVKTVTLTITAPINIQPPFNGHEVITIQVPYETAVSFDFNVEYLSQHNQVLQSYRQLQIIRHVESGTDSIVNPERIISYTPEQGFSGNDYLILKGVFG